MKHKLGGLRGGLLGAFVSVALYLMGSILIANIPHKPFFNYTTITPATYTVGDKIAFTSYLDRRQPGHYYFKDALSCVINGDYTRIGIAYTEGVPHLPQEIYRVTWTWREDNPWIIEEGTTTCTLLSTITYRILGIIPVTQELTTVVEIQP